MLLFKRERERKRKWMGGWVYIIIWDSVGIYSVEKEERKKSCEFVLLFFFDSIVVG